MELKISEEEFLDLKSYNCEGWVVSYVLTQYYLSTSSLRRSQVFGDNVVKVVSELMSNTNCV